MKNVLNLEKSSVHELDRTELTEIDGGEPVTITLATIGVVVGIAVGLITLCDKVHEIGEELGRELAK